MESTESIKELIEKTKGKDEWQDSSAYLPELEYNSSPKVMKEGLTLSFNSDNNNSIANASQLNTAVIVLPKKLKGINGTYEILPKITVEVAKELQSQTGLVISFEAGKEYAEFIGNKGHFGQLRLGKEKSTGRYYGIKEIKGEDKVEESLEEAKLQRKLTGLSHLMPLIDAIELQDAQGHKQLYHVMPLAALGNGKELANYLGQIKDKGFKEALLVHVAKCVLKGFKELHTRNIAHLDFKPDNLVVDATGNVLVIDFGCAKELDKEGYVRGRSLGDTRYYSPERDASSFNFTGKANDCYAIGLSLLELAIGMITNKKEMKAEDYLTHPYLQDALPGTYAGLVKGLLEINPDKRLKVEEALSLELFAKETKPEILSYLREFVQSLQWEQRVKETKGIQKTLTSAQQLPLPHFTGYVHRPIEAKVIARLLEGSSLPIACTGLGGVGKTQLLTYLVHTSEVQARFKSIFWFRAADNETSLNIQYYGLAQELKLIEEKTPLDEAKRILIGWFENASQPWLIVFDNADNPETLRQYLPSKGGSILLSSRSPEWQEAISLDILTVEEVQEMLAKAMPERTVSLEEAKELGERLGYLPLALSQAIAMIRQEGLDIKDYVESFRKKQQELLSANTNLFGKHLPHSMVTLYQLQLAKLKKECPEAIQLLQYSALLAPDAIPVALMEEVLGEGINEETYQKAQQLLIRYALWQLKEDDVYIHRLMQEVVRMPLSQEDLNSMFLVIGQRCHEEYNKEMTVLADEQRKKSLLLHLEALKTWGEKEESLKTTIPFANILFNIGVYYLYQTEQFQIARPLFEVALAIKEKHYGKDHPETGITLTNLGNVYGALGNYEQQKDLLLKSLAISEKCYGKEHPQTGIILTNLGNAYGALGEHEKQRNLLCRSLAIKEKHYGKEHPSTGSTLTNLGIAYSSLGEYKKQRDILLKALVINEKHYGKDHPNTGIILTNLGIAYGALGEYEKQRDLLCRSLMIHEKHYGKDHSSTGSILTNLGNAYGYLGEYEKQRDLLLRALSIIEKHYSKDHPETGNTLGNLGNAYGSLGEYEKQKDLLLRALVIHEKHYGKDHPFIGINLTNLGNAYGDLGEYEKQRDLLLRALSIIEKHYGKDHVETGNILGSLGNAYSALGEYRKRRDLLLRALTINEKHYGKDHLQTGITLANLGNAYFKLNDVKIAYPYQKRAYDIFFKFYGAEHQYTKSAFQQLQLYKMGVSSKQDFSDSVVTETLFQKSHELNKQGLQHYRVKKYNEALELFQQALKLQQQITIKSIEEIASLHFNIGTVYVFKQDYPSAFKHLQSAYQMRLRLLGTNHLSTQKAQERLQECESKLNGSQIQYSSIQTMQTDHYTLDNKIPIKDTSLIEWLKSKTQLNFTGVRDKSYKVDAVVLLNTETEIEKVKFIQSDLKGKGLFFQYQRNGQITKGFVLEGINISEGNPTMGNIIRSYILTKEI